MNSLILNKIY